MTSPSERISLGMIGVGTMGSGHLLEFLQHRDVQIVAIADLRQSRRDWARSVVRETYASQARMSRDCDLHMDYRDLLARPDIDAVCIAVPDHWHASIAIAAMKAGKDVYLEKPMSITVEEGRAICHTAELYGRVFQHGTQQRSAHQFGFACELATGGRLGKVHTAHVWSPTNLAGGDPGPSPLPTDFEYNRWLGPAPWAPYSEDRCGIGKWYHVSDYTIGGFIGGWAIHHIDIAQWGLGTEMTGPVEVVGKAEIPKVGLYDTPVRFHFECRYANGLRMIVDDDSEHVNGTTFIGEEGWFHVNRSGLDAEPRSLLDTRRSQGSRWYESGNHQRNWLECIKTRRQTIAPAEVAHRSTTICELGMIAITTGEKLAWNPALETFPNSERANRMLSRTYRNGYVIGS